MTYLWCAVAVLLLLLVVVSVYALHLNTRLSLVEQRVGQQLQALQHELAVINSAAIGVGQRLINTEKKLRGAIEKQQQFETVSADQLPFNQAFAMAEKGAGARQLVEQCGLSEAEAELVALMKGAAKNAATPAV